MMRIFNYGIAILFMSLYTACRENPEKGPREGNWHAMLEVMDGDKLPFTFTLETEDDGYTMAIRNADELILADEIRIRGNTIRIQMPVFEEYIGASFSDTIINGYLINESRGRKVPFVASYGERPRFRMPVKPRTDISGEWEVVFSPGTGEAYPAHGIFSQDKGIVEGTFRTGTGDRRFLEGVVSGDSLKLSTFDGTHAYLFLAEVSDSLMKGVYYSGNHFKQPFEGRRNPGFELADEDSLTFLKEGYTRFDFNFPDADGNMVSLSDPQFKDKVVIVQLMGSWCPNCLDETRFFSEYMSANPGEDLQLVALAFEYAKTREKALAGIRRLKDRVGINYPVLLAQFGGTDKEEAGRKLPMLNQLLSYPTTVFIDKRGQVRRIHTGFNGPATGEKYDEFRKEFDSLVQKLRSE
jgi:thiol-disulfide isomerase/thioredoxin